MEYPQIQVSWLWNWKFCALTCLGFGWMYCLAQVMALCYSCFKNSNGHTLRAAGRQTAFHQGFS